MMRFFKKKKIKTDRRVFGFTCDNDLADRVRDLAWYYEIPIYCLAEHLLQLGLAHMGIELRDNPESFKQVIEGQHDHMVDYHLLVKKLGEEEHERELIAQHAELTTEHKDQVEAVIDLVKKLGKEGTPHQRVIMAVEIMVASLNERQKKVENMQ